MRFTMEELEFKHGLNKELAKTGLIIRTYPSPVGLTESICDNAEDHYVYSLGMKRKNLPEMLMLCNGFNSVPISVEEFNFRAKEAQDFVQGIFDTEYDDFIPGELYVSKSKESTWVCIRYEDICSPDEFTESVKWALMKETTLYHKPQDYKVLTFVFYKRTTQEEISKAQKENEK